MTGEQLEMVRLRKMTFDPAHERAADPPTLEMRMHDQPANMTDAILDPGSHGADDAREIAICCLEKNLPVELGQQRVLNFKDSRSLRRPRRGCNLDDVRRPGGFLG